MTQESETELLACRHQIIKSDELGRVRVTAERREELVAAFERSGMSAAAFARWSGVKYSTFAAWAARARKARGEPRGCPSSPGESSGAMSWAEVVCGGEGPRVAEAGLVIHLGTGVRVEARDGRLAADLLTAMGVRAC